MKEYTDSKEIKLLVDGWMEMAENFGAKTYAATFRQYLDSNCGTVAELSQTVETDRTAVQAFARAAIDRLAGQMKQCPSWKKLFGKGNVLLDARLFLSVYLSPMILSTKEAIAEDLAVAVRKQWTKEFPKEPYEFGTFEAIEEDFHRGGQWLQLFRNK